MDRKDETKRNVRHVLIRSCALSSRRTRLSGRRSHRRGTRAVGARELHGGTAAQLGTGGQQSGHCRGRELGWSTGSRSAFATRTASQWTAESSGCEVRFFVASRSLFHRSPAAAKPRARIATVAALPAKGGEVNRVGLTCSSATGGNQNFSGGNMASVVGGSLNQASLDSATDGCPMCWWPHHPMILPNPGIRDLFDRTR
jgi:hypothetical protein